MKIIFLDFDGVLNSRNYDRQRDFRRSDNAFDDTRFPLLKKIVEHTGAKIVITTTWRTHWHKDKSKNDETGEYIDNLFKKHGLTIYDKTPLIGIGSDRAEEVKSYLEYPEEEVESFVIIDDYMFSWGDLQDKFVKTNAYKDGLDEENVKEAIKILNG